MIMVNQNNIYIGGIEKDIDAARYYDHIAIISQGLGAKTNFKYTGYELQKILNTYRYDYDKSENFSNSENIKDEYFNDKHKLLNFQSEHQLKRQRFADSKNSDGSSSQGENQMIKDSLFNNLGVNFSKQSQNIFGSGIDMN